MESFNFEINLASRDVLSCNLPFFKNGGKVTAILGISAYYHDSGAALIVDGKVVAAAQEERFTRKKHDPSFPVNATQFCLQWGGYKLQELDAIVFYDKPLLKMERLLETYYSFAPAGLRSFLSAIPVWIKEKLFLRKMIRDELIKIDPEVEVDKTKVLFPEHHLSHAASAFYPSPYQEAAILTIDGVGEWATASIGVGRGKELEILKELRFPHSVGLLYSAFTYYLGFRVNSGEYKLMGLAPYGDPTSSQTKEFYDKILNHLVDVREDGSIWLDQSYFNYATGLTMAVDSKWEKLFGFPRRKPESEELAQHHCNLGMAIQWVTEEIVLKMGETAKKLSGCEYLTMAGGVALNCVANGKLLRSGIFKDIWIQPAAGDAGGALGAALSAYHLYFGKERDRSEQIDTMQGSYLGPEATSQEIEFMARSYKAPFKRFDCFDELASEVAKLLCEGNVVGWHQGRMEWGPRALGNRTILGDPRNPEMQKKLNLKIKYRESFRPFAPSVLAQDCKEYFELEHDSPYMLLVADVAKKRRKELPENYHSLSLREKLYYERSDLPSITHLDFSARVQTVHQETNPRYHLLLEKIKERSGSSVVINTSFNVRGEPPVCVPDDSYRCFMRTEMDFLVVENYLFCKKEQPDWQEKSNWEQEFVLD